MGGFVLPKCGATAYPSEKIIKGFTWGHGIVPCTNKLKVFWPVSSKCQYPVIYYRYDKHA